MKTMGKLMDELMKKIRREKEGKENRNQAGQQSQLRTVGFD
jgi:hypothetical protein